MISACPSPVFLLKHCATVRLFWRPLHRWSCFPNLALLTVCVAVAGSGAGLFLWPCGTLHLGRGDPCSWSELHHDWNVFWPVCHGGQWKNEESIVHTRTHSTSGNVSFAQPSPFVINIFSQICPLVLWHFLWHFIWPGFTSRRPVWNPAVFM